MKLRRQSPNASAGMAQVKIASPELRQSRPLPWQPTPAHDRRVAASAMGRFPQQGTGRKLHRRRQGETHALAGSGLGKRSAVGIMKRRNPGGKRLQALRQQAFQPIARNEGMAGFDKHPR